MATEEELILHFVGPNLGWLIAPGRHAEVEPVALHEHPHASQSPRRCCFRAPPRRASCLSRQRKDDPGDHRRIAESSAQVAMARAYPVLVMSMRSPTPSRGQGRFSSYDTIPTQRNLALEDHRPMTSLIKDNGLPIQPYSKLNLA